MNAELKKIEGAKGTKDAAEELFAFVKKNEASDPLVTKQADNPYSASAKAGTGCC